MTALAKTAQAGASGPGTTGPIGPSSRRLMSVDALRGFDMFWIVGAGTLVYALQRMRPSPLTTFLATQLEHVEWEGLHFYDLIFPLFLFIVGVSTVFSLGRLLRESGRSAALKRVVRRSVLLYLVAFIYARGFTNPWPDVQLMGVLFRIALCYLFAGTLLCLVPWRGLVGITAALLLGYWALLAWVPFPDVRPASGGLQVINRSNAPTLAQLDMASTNLIHGVYAQGVNLTSYFDQKYLAGRKSDGTYSPEGCLSTLPAIATCLLGVFAGLLLANPAVSDSRKVVYLLGFGAAGVLLGFLWGQSFPIVKRIWTSSYVLATGGYSAILLGVFFYVVDVLKFQKWCQPFVWMGMNSITIYVTSNFIGGFAKLGERLAGGNIRAFLDHQVAPGFGDLVVALVGLLLAFWFVRFLYTHKLFLRL